MKHIVLDHGYLQLVECWGSDERIIEAARMSTGKGFKGWGPKHDTNCKYWRASGDGECNCIPEAGDEKLLKFLWDNKHHTPFEMAGITIEVQAPLFVLREWHRHRTQSYNELSARYTPMPNVNYFPAFLRCAMGSSSNKQAAGVQPFDEKLVNDWLSDLSHFYDHAQRLYEYGLNAGLPKEIARIVVPVARYSRMRASANLRNWLSFITLRAASNAQWEIRQYANALCHIVKQLFPRTWECYNQLEAK